MVIVYDVGGERQSLEEKKTTTPSEEPIPGTVESFIYPSETREYQERREAKEMAMQYSREQRRESPYQYLPFREEKTERRREAAGFQERFYSFPGMLEVKGFFEQLGRYAEWFAYREEYSRKIQDIQTAFSYSGQLGLKLPDIGRYAEYFAYKSEHAKSIEEIQKAFSYSGQYGLKLKEIGEYAEAFAESSKFWREQGYPEYVGRYMPVTIPEGYKISNVKETPSGLEVSFEPIVSMEHVMKGLEKNFGVSVGSAKALTIDEYRDVYRGFAKQVEQEGYKSVEEFRLAASTLAAASIPYASLHVGLPFVTLKGFLTNVALGVGLTQTIVGITQQRLITPLEAAASAAYTELAYIGTSALFHYVITPKAAEWLTTRYWQRASEALSTGQTPRLTRFEKTVSFLTGAKPYVPTQVVTIPEFAKPTATDIYKQMQAWELAVSPKTSALLLTEMGSPVSSQTSRVAAWVSEHWLKKATGGLSYALIEQELAAATPAVYAGVPYVPAAITPTVGKSILPSLISGTTGAAAALQVKPEKVSAALPKLDITPELAEFTFPKLQRELTMPVPVVVFGSIESLVYLPEITPTQTQRQYSITVPVVTTIPKPLLTRSTSILETETPTVTTYQTPKITPEVSLATPQTPWQITTPKIITPQVPPFPKPPEITTPPIKYPKLPEAFSIPDYAKLFRGAWFKRVHPILTPEKYLKQFRAGFGKVKTKAKAGKAKGRGKTSKRVVVARKRRKR